MECQVRDITMYYEEAGAGRPLLALHGWPLDHRQMANWMEPLFVHRTGWRRIYLDLPGMGKTHGADWISCQDQVLDLIIAFIDSVAPGERFVVAGHSYGGYLARGLVYAKGDGMDGVLLHAPVVHEEAAKEDLPQHVVLHEDGDFLAALKPEEQSLRELVVVQSMDLLAEFRQVVMPARAIADYAFLERLDQHFTFSFDVDALPAPFPAPALFLTGRQDSGTGYREAFDLLPNYPRATYAVLDRAGHPLGFEQKALFRALVGEWLDRVEEYAAAAHAP